MDPPKAKRSINARTFYENWSGHQLSLLDRLFVQLNENSNDEEKSIIWLAGDSSLDNKHWCYANPDLKSAEYFVDPSYTAKACNGYEKILDPPNSIQDVCYHLNHVLEKEKSPFVCINTAIEATTLAERDEELLSQVTCI